MGRKPDGWRSVGSLEGSPEAKKRLEVILKQLGGETTIEEACEELGIRPSMLQKLRSRTLQQMVESLEARRPGPAPRAPAPKEMTDRIGALEDEVRRLRIELAKSQAREDLARWRGSGGEKGSRAKRR